MTVGRIARLSGLQEEVVRLRAELRDRYRFENIVGTSMAMQRVYERIDAASKTSSTVLICGESGTGKELVAKAVHYNGVRSDKPFVPVNCAAMPRELIESELFGHKRGAFTGAVSDAVGLFRSADGGTIFLDEVVEMPYGTQAKLLRALQERQIRPVGGATELPVDVRVIASTNQDVTEALRADKLRTDLYYRLSVIRIDVPPLRVRLDDIPALVNHFIAKFGRLTPRTVKAVSDDALGVLAAYAWPGNVRELESAVENAFVLGKTDVIGKDDLPPHVVEQADARSPAQAEDTQDIPTLSESQWELGVRTLEATGGNKTRAARILGISRPRLYNMLRRHGMGA